MSDDYSLFETQLLTRPGSYSSSTSRLRHGDMSLNTHVPWIVVANPFSHHGLSGDSLCIMARATTATTTATTIGIIQASHPFIFFTPFLFYDKNEAFKSSTSSSSSCQGRHMGFSNMRGFSSSMNFFTVETIKCH